MIDITGIEKTPIYSNRLLRRLLIVEITKSITKDGRIDSPDVKALGAILPILDRELEFRMPLFIYV